MAFGKETKEKCIVCGNAIDITEMVVLDGRKIVCACCAKQVAGAMGYAKIQPKTDADREYIRKDKSKKGALRVERCTIFGGSFNGVCTDGVILREGLLQ